MPHLAYVEMFRAVRRGQERLRLRTRHTRALLRAIKADLRRLESIVIPANQNEARPRLRAVS